MSKVKRKSRKPDSSIYRRILSILESAKAGVARTVNTAHVMSCWLIGYEIVEAERKSKSESGYGQRLVRELSLRLSKQFGQGYSAPNLWLMRQFVLVYPGLISDPKKLYAVRRVSDLVPATEKLYALRRESWEPGLLSTNLSWTHYRTLLRVEKKEARAFYEIEAVNNGWTARELERQVNSLLFERLSLSKNKAGLIKLSRKGHEVQSSEDAFKDPLIIEFLGLPSSPQITESDLEQALINNLQEFLLELGRGFAFVARQERITLEGDHFYIDLVFYHTVLKCYVLIELKTGKLTHQDLGQLQLYVNYYDQERRTKDDNPTLGLILCTDKNDTVVKYTLGPDQQKTIFASRYKLHLPTEAELKAEIAKELRQIAPARSKPNVKKKRGKRK